MILDSIDSKLLARPFDEALELETKADLLQAVDLWGLKIPHSGRKSEIALALKSFLEIDAQYVWNYLRSDAKSPKTLMKEYFGFDTLPVDEWPEGLGIKPIVDDLDELGNLDELDDEDDWDEPDE